MKWQIFCNPFSQSVSKAQDYSTATTIMIDLLSTPFRILQQDQGLGIESLTTVFLYIMLMLNYVFYSFYIMFTRTSTRLAQYFASKFLHIHSFVIPEKRVCWMVSLWFLFHEHEKGKRCRLGCVFCNQND